MKRIILGLSLLLCINFATVAQELPAPSPYGEVMQRVGLTDVTVAYSRPGVKDRVIFGDLEPFNQVWRTGANASTKITFSTDVEIMGNKVEAGTYSVMSIPGEEKWTVMLNTDLNVQEGSYDAEKDVLKVEVEAKKLASPTETMIFYFANVKSDEAHWVFEWENYSWAIPIKVAVEEQAMENIKNEISKVENAYSLYNNAARYYLNNDKDLEQAKKWSEKSVSISEKFWNVYTLSLIQAKMGDYKGAVKTAKKSLELAKAADYQPYVKMNEKNISEWSKK